MAMSNMNLIVACSGGGGGGGGDVGGGAIKNIILPKFSNFGDIIMCSIGSHVFIHYYKLHVEYMYMFMVSLSTGFFFA